MRFFNGFRNFFSNFMRREKPPDFISRYFSMNAKLPPPIVTLSVKGGPGKTLITGNLALRLAETGKKVGILDADIENPSLMRYYGLLGKKMTTDPKTRKHRPLNFRGIEIYSMGAFLMDSPHRAAYWDGKTVQQYLIDGIFGANWGELDYFLVDMPPSQSDEFIVLRNVFKKLKGVIIVGTSEKQCVDGSERTLNLCLRFGIPILGLVENKSGSESDCCGAPFVCQKCGKEQDPYGHGEIEALATRYNVKFSGRIPFNPRINRNSKEKHFIFNDYPTFNNLLEELNCHG